MPSIFRVRTKFLPSHLCKNLPSWRNVSVPSILHGTRRRLAVLSGRDLSQTGANLRQQLRNRLQPAEGAASRCRKSKCRFHLTTPGSPPQGLGQVVRLGQVKLG
jgi:hypothetical protein